MLATAVLEKLINSTPAAGIAHVFYGALGDVAARTLIAALPPASQRLLLQALLDVACQ